MRMLWTTAAWGACFVAIRWGLRDASVLWFAMLRSTIGGMALVTLGLIQRRPLPATLTSWVRITALGLFNGAFAFGAMFAGAEGLATGTAAVLANAQPLLIVLPAWWLFSERVTARNGLVLALASSASSSSPHPAVADPARCCRFSRQPP
ncbi:DMT family transporter [Iamia sp. SCSIO 61187]|nr:DMT family transporter [Iamia sp. SCSIO 61187]